MALGLLLAGCGDDAAERLATDEQVAYAVLLQEFQRVIGTETELPPVNICIQVSLPYGGKVHDMTGFLQKLRADLPADWSITLAPMENCKRFSKFGPYRLPNGMPARVFFVARMAEDIDPDVPPVRQVWHAGTICGPLCGIGGIYHFRFEDGRPTITYVSNWVS